MNSRETMVLDKIARQYPSDIAALFSGSRINARPSGRALSAALRSGKITPGKLYDSTFGNYSNATGDEKKDEKSKFQSLLDTVMGTAKQAADIYTQVKTNKDPGQAQDQTHHDNNTNTGNGNARMRKKMPWLPIAAGAIVVILVIVLIILKRKK
jgi:hypothetical protein